MIKIFSGVRIEDIADIKRNKTAQLHYISNELFHMDSGHYKTHWNVFIKSQVDNFQWN